MKPASEQTVAGPRRAVLIIVGVILIAASCALGLAILLRQEPFAVDTWWNVLLVTGAMPFLDEVAMVMDFLGGGLVGVLIVPAIGTIALLIIRRPWSALFFVTAEIASALSVQVLKHLFGRARPEDILVLSDFGSYPSGHVANAATIAVAAFVIFPRWWVAIVGVAWVLLMALSRTLLHAHWFSDTIGGALVGAGVVLILAGLFAPLLRRERPVRPSDRSDAAVESSH